MLATAGSSFHLSVLEATYLNSLQPIPCRQKDLVYLPANFTLISCAHFELKQNNIFRPIKLSKRQILTN